MNGFEDYIDGTKKCPPKEIRSGEANPEFIKWRRLDRLILSWIYSTLTPDIMSQIVGYETSHEAWIALERIFSASSKARIMQLRFEFQTIKKGDDTTMEYILKVKTITDNLAAIIVASIVASLTLLVYAIKKKIKSSNLGRFGTRIQFYSCFFNI